MTQDYTTSFTVDQTPEEATAAINNVRAWWSGQIDGVTDKAGDVWMYRYADLHRSVMKTAEIVPGKKVVWQVLDAYLSFIEDKTEWNGTAIVFDVAEKDGKTEVRFTHQGLVPQVECYDVCVDAWGTYIHTSLKNLIATGKGMPDQNQEIAEKWQL